MYIKWIQFFFSLLPRGCIGGEEKLIAYKMLMWLSIRWLLHHLAQYCFSTSHTTQLNALLSIKKIIFPSHHIFCSSCHPTSFSMLYDTFFFYSSSCVCCAYCMESFSSKLNKYRKTDTSQLFIYHWQYTKDIFASWSFHYILLLCFFLLLKLQSTT